MLKQCTKCKSSYLQSEFTKSKSRKDGLSAWCKPCNQACSYARRKSLSDADKQRERGYQKSYRQENLAALKAYRKNHYLENRAAYLDAAKFWSMANGKSRANACKRYRERNGAALISTRRRYRLRNLANPEYIARRAASSMLHRVLSLTGADKNDRTSDLLGYSHDELIAHLEKRFVGDMSWSNYGDWHIDHIIAVSELISLGVTDPKEINALKNIRPLWALDNMKKHAKFDLCHSDIEFIKAKRV